MRVIAFKSFKDGVMKSYGEGEYVGYRIPNTELFKSFQITNPCIKLDSGKYVWGLMCWWGSLEIFKEQYGSFIKETIIIEPDENILPLCPTCEVSENECKCPVIFGPVKSEIH